MREYILINNASGHSTAPSTKYLASQQLNGYFLLSGNVFEFRSIHFNTISYKILGIKFHKYLQLIYIAQKKLWLGLIHINQCIGSMKKLLCFLYIKFSIIKRKEKSFPNPQKNKLFKIFVDLLLI